jgi:hypothetical protein
MLDELLGINAATVVVLKGSNPVLMPWIDVPRIGLSFVAVSSVSL